MSLKFGVYNIPDPENKGKSLQHARILPQGTKRIEDICEYLSDISTLSSADIKGTLEGLTHYIGMQLKFGSSVELEGLGYFSVALKSEQTKNEKGKTIVKVSVDGVNFRCSTRLKNKVKEARPKREKRKNITGFTPEQRKTRMLEYLEKHDYINIIDYASLNGCTRYRATEDLKQHLADGIIDKMGYRTHRIYVLPTKE